MPALDAPAAPAASAAPDAPAVSRAALPTLKWFYRRAFVHSRKSEACKRQFAAEIVDLRAQIRAALSGAPTWTDSCGSVWGPGGLLVSGTVPPPGLWHGGAGF
jgi:hypothetical protein